MRIDGSSLNPFAGIQPFGPQTQSGSGIPGVPGLAQSNEQSSAFTIRVASYPPPPPPGLEGVFDHPGSAIETKTMTELVEEMGKPESTSDVFALEMVRRMQGQKDENGEVKDATRLGNALKNAVKWVQDQHGDMTANSLMATVLGSTGDAASEQTVSNGLVNALKLVDQTHGMNAGDAAMAHFNGELNNALNDYFDNGQSEKFLAMQSSGAHGMSMAAANLSSRFARQSTEAAYKATSEQSLTDTMLKNMTKELDEATDPDAMAKAKAKKAMAAYGFVAAPEPELLSASA